jgi:hypothetical protein
MAEIADLPLFLTTNETAELVRTTAQTLAQDRYLGRGLPYIKRGSSVLYDRRDVLAYLDARRQVPASA